MMKNVLLLMIVLAFVGCKDVEKNPSGCGYDMTNEDGMCVKLSYKGQKILNEVAKSSFIKDYFELVQDTYFDRTVYNPILSKFLEDLNGDNPISSMITLSKKLNKNIEFIEFKVSELKLINDRSYSNTVYNQLSRLEDLQRDMEMLKNAINYTSNKDHLIYDYQYYDADQKAQYAKKYEDRVSDLKLKADMENQAFGLFETEVQHARGSGYNYKVKFLYRYVDRNGAEVQSLKNGLEVHMLQDPTCQGDQLAVCIDEYYELVEDEANAFYKSLIK